MDDGPENNGPVFCLTKTIESRKNNHFCYRNLVDYLCWKIYM